MKFQILDLRMFWTESSKNYLSYFGIVLIVLYLYLNRKKNYWKTRNVPHRKPTIFFGHFLEIILKREFPGNYYKKLYDDFQGPYVGWLSFTKPVILIKDLDIIKNILIKNFNSFQDRMPVADENIDPFLANALLGVKGDKWSILRKKLSPVFTSGKIKLMIELMKECGENMVKYIGNNIEDSTEVKGTVSKYTTDVISSCAFGINANSFESEDSEFRAAGKKLFEPTFGRMIIGITYFMVPICVKLFKYPFFDLNAIGFLREAFNKTIEKREESKVIRNDMIDILIKLKNQNQDSEFKFYGDRLVAQAISFFSAGQETTSQVISFTMHELCIHTDIQERLRNEIEDCIAQHGELTYEAVADMTYLDMVVSETLRKYPTIPFMQRVCTENYTIPETGLEIEKDTIILISPYALHWDPKYFSDPEIFDPERFNEDNKKNIVPYTYMPFGDGPRNCIGERFGLLSTKLAIVYLLRNFQVKRNSLTTEPIIFLSSGLANVQGGVQVTFTKL